MSKKMQPIDIAERSKIGKLQSEIKSENADHKVEWLYTGDKIDRDAYLLGKPIDKILIEKELEKPKETDIFSNTIDLANKIREDPLFEIKKREIEAKKRLLENPMRLKQLKQMIKSKLSEKETESESDSESDRKREKRHHKKKSSKKSRKHKHSDDENSDYERRRKKSRSRSPDRRGDKYGLDDRHKRDKRESPRDKDRNRDRDAVKPKSHVEIEEYKKKIEKLSQIRKNTESDYKPGQGASRGTSNKLSEEEKRRRLAEMEENAKWRSDVRSKNISKYKHDAKKEDELQERDKSHQMQNEAANMFNDIMRDAYVSTEDRIKRNMHNIQRNKSSYDRNFARK